MPGYENRPKEGSARRADPCHKAPCRASVGLVLTEVGSRSFPAGTVYQPAKPEERYKINDSRAFSRDLPLSGNPIVRESAIARTVIETQYALRAMVAAGSRPPGAIPCRAGFNANGPKMQDKEKHENQSRAAADPRRDRLRLALRENLKRRKSQARGRNDMTAEPAETAATSPSQQHHIVPDE
jgi:hypothetical protein